MKKNAGINGVIMTPPEVLEYMGTLEVQGPKAFKVELLVAHLAARQATERDAWTGGK